MRVFLWITGMILFYISSSNAQTKLEWNELIELQMVDFQSPATQIGQGNIYRLQSGIRMEFSYQMSQAEFMFKKNFNKAAVCAFNPELASIVAPDDNIAFQLLNFARFEFDLTELYTRKFRKRLYGQKKAFTKGDWYLEIFNEIQGELELRISAAGNATDIGRKEEKLKALHDEVREELKTLADFCQTCKPKRKK